jgi:hypothetical protein
MGAMEKPPQILEQVKLYIPTQERLKVLREHEKSRSVCFFNFDRIHSFL